MPFLTPCKPYSINRTDDMYFCTDVISGWKYIFTSHEFFNIIIDSLAYCRERKGLCIHGYVIMPNHVHTILSAKDSNLSDILRDYKRFTSKRITEALIESSNKKLRKYFSIVAQMAEKGNHYKVWKQGSHPILIDNIDMFYQRLDYLHNNPVKKGYVESAEHWLYSSARNYYLNDHSIMKIDMIK